MIPCPSMTTYDIERLSVWFESDVEESDTYNIGPATLAIHTGKAKIYVDKDRCDDAGLPRDIDSWVVMASEKEDDGVELRYVGEVQYTATVNRNGDRHRKLVCDPDTVVE